VVAFGTPHGTNRHRAHGPWRGPGAQAGPHPGFDTVRARVHESLQRARQTCALAGFGASPEIAPDLAEWDYGEYEGQRSSDIRMTRPGWTVYRDGCPGGEDASQVSDRADRLIAKLQALRGNIALFLHGQFACSFAARWIGSPVSQGQHLMLGTASLSVLGCNPSHPDIRVIVHWNASASLERPS
jgi:broad specificity phosphatase PhoE